MTNINKNKKKYIPSSFLVIIGLMLLFIFASWIGTVIDPNRIEGVGVLDVFTSIWKGFRSKTEVIIFIFSIGGTLAVMTKIKAIDAGIDAIVHKIGDKTLMLIPALMLIFGLGGTTYGMWEETIAFIPVLIPVFKKAGYGTFTAILTILLGAGTGCLASTINPFAIGAAVTAVNDIKGVDGIGAGSNLTLTTGSLQGIRWISFILFEGLAICLVTWLATRYKKGIESGLKTDKEVIASISENKEEMIYDSENNNNNAFVSFLKKTKFAFVHFFSRPRVVEGIDEKLIEKRFPEVEKTEFTIKRKISLTLFVLSFVLMILMYLPWADIMGWGKDVPTSVSNYDKWGWIFASTKESGFAKIWDGAYGWYFISVSAIFLLTTIIIFAINFQEFKSEEENAEQGLVNTYMDGVKDMVSVSLLIATAAGLGEILNATKFGTLIAEESAKGLTNWVAFGVVVFFASILLSLLVPSTSGFAAAFVPIFAGIAAKAFPENKEAAIGISILAFIFANGLANFVTPTSAALMGYTQYAGVPYNVWIKQVWRFVLPMFFLALLLIIVFSAIASGGSNLF